MPFPATSLAEYGDWMRTIVLKPVVVVKLIDGDGEEGVCRATVTLYRLGLPRFHGYQSSGTPFLTRKLVVTRVTSSMFPLNFATRIEPDDTPNSGNETVMLGLGSATIERTKSVTFTIQSAFWSGGIEGRWPSLWISIDFSSIKREGEKVIGDVGGDDTGADECEGDFDEESRSRNAGLKIPLGTKAGPLKTDR